MSTATVESKIFTREEVAKHNTPEDLWIIIDSKVYDLTRFKSLHPGGLSVLLDEDVAGQDATEAFFGLHRYEVLEKYRRLEIGVIDGEAPSTHGRVSNQLSRVPYAEPMSLSPGYHSAFYNEGHKKLQLALRAFFEEVVYPESQVHEASGKQPSRAVFDKLAEKGVFAMRLGPGKHLRGLKLMDGVVEPEKFDYFHELILTQELTRVCLRGYGDGLLSGLVIGLPPILNFGSDELKARIVSDVLSAKKVICLAISEAQAGSDVLGMKTTATKSEDGKHWIVNGTKKWITNGTFADYFTVGCKTENGFTVILVERGPGVETKAIKTGYSPSAGTAFVTFDNVKVPIENTVGEEGQGIFVMMSNFNHERFTLICVAARSQRLAVEECLKWATQRQVFGKPLSSQPVIRSLLAGMISRTEAVQSWLENVTYQMCNMSYRQQSKYLAGPIALLKSYTTQCSQDTARDAIKVFGGRGITQTGMGRFVEHLYRVAPFDAILGGTEDILADLGVRQAVRDMPKDAKL